MTDATTGIPVWAEIRKATQFDYKKTVEEQWQTSWLSDFIQTDSLEKYALEIAATGELVGLGAYRDMPEGVLVYVEYIESAPHSNPTLAGRRKYKGIGAALLAYGMMPGSKVWEISENGISSQPYHPPNLLCYNGYRFEGW